jgi:hypothetical protein
MASFRLVAFNSEGQLKPPTGGDSGLVELLAVGTELSFSTLNKVDVDNLNLLLGGGDADGLHNHDTRYYTQTQLQNTVPNNTGADLVIATNPYGGSATVQAVLNQIANELSQVDQAGMDWQNSVLDKDLSTPPLGPGAGERYLLGLSTLDSNATGAWTGRDGQIAQWNGAIWEFTTPQPGMFVTADDEPNSLYYFNGVLWEPRAFESTTASGFLSVNAGNITLDNLIEKNVIVGNASSEAVAVDTGAVGQVEATSAGLFVKDLSLDGSLVLQPFTVPTSSLQVSTPGDVVIYDFQGYAVAQTVSGDVLINEDAITSIQPDVIKDSMIDWGLNVNQVNDADIPTAYTTPVNWAAQATTHAQFSAIDGALTTTNTNISNLVSEDLTFLKIDGTRAMTGNLNMNSQSIISANSIGTDYVTDSSGNAAIDLLTLDTVRLSRKITFTGGPFKIENVADGGISSDAANYGQLTALQTNINTTIDNLTTADIAESGSLYYTDERVDDRVAALIQNGTGLTWTYNDVSNTHTGNVSLSPFSTDDLSEGSTNLYYTQARFDSAFSAKTTADLSEGTNLYFTENRARTTSLTGLVTTTPGPISATDTIVVALGKLQNSVNSNTATTWKTSGNTLASHGILGSNSASFHVTLKSENQDYALLSNNVFEIYKSIVPSPDQSLALGTLSNAFNNTYTKSVNFASGSTSYGTMVGSATGLEILHTGPGSSQKLTARTIQQSGETAAIEITTGDSTVAGNSGNILLQTGTVLSGTRGTISLDAEADGALLVNAPSGSTGLAIACVSYVNSTISTEITNNAANRALSNLSSVAINTSLLPDTNITHDLGSDTLRFRDLYLSGSSIYLGDLVFTDNAGLLRVEDVNNPGIAAISTDDTVEGATNLFYTDARVDTRIGAATLDSLSDVGDLSAIQDGETLVWNNTAGEFQAGSSSSLDYNVITAVEAGSYAATNDEAYVFLNPAADLNAYTVTLPVTPKDGQEVSISTNDHGIVSMTVSPAGGQSIINEAGVIRLPSNSHVKYKWINSLSSWILVDKSPFVTAITNGFERETKVLSAAQITAKSITLLRAPVQPEITTIEFHGGTRQFYGVDFSVNGNVLQWNGLGLDGFIEENDIIEIRY